MGLTAIKECLIIVALYYGILTCSLKHQPTLIRAESMFSEDKNLVIIYRWNLQRIVQNDEVLIFQRFETWSIWYKP